MFGRRLSASPQTIDELLVDTQWKLHDAKTSMENALRASTLEGAESYIKDALDKINEAMSIIGVEL